MHNPHACNVFIYIPVQVRSLRLDKWSKTLRLLMDAMGNERFNSVFEANVPPSTHTSVHLRLARAPTICM